jgi:hypothetical protein
MSTKKQRREERWWEEMVRDANKDQYDRIWTDPEKLPLVKRGKSKPHWEDTSGHVPKAPRWVKQKRLPGWLVLRWGGDKLEVVPGVAGPERYTVYLNGIKLKDNLSYEDAKWLGKTYLEEKAKLNGTAE